uniref:protein S100-A8-like n=1 Tax=Euleptes europaea TaxID=460621 RepID=UPI002541644F|nr:protein S100-A8-like [Euleptes europaea]
MKTKLEQALECVVNVYHRYCFLDPSDDYLQLKEFQKLMKEQAQPFLKDTTPPHFSENDFIRTLFQVADVDQNNYLKFTEFLIVFAALLKDAHERSHDFGADNSRHSH